MENKEMYSVEFEYNGKKQTRLFFTPQDLSAVSREVQEEQSLIAAESLLKLEKCLLDGGRLSFINLYDANGCVITKR